MVLILSGNFITAQTKWDEAQQEVQITIVAMFQGSADRDSLNLNFNNIFLLSSSTGHNPNSTPAQSFLSLCVMQSNT